MRENEHGPKGISGVTGTLSSFLLHLKGLFSPFFLLVQRILFNHSSDTIMHPGVGENRFGVVGAGI